MQSMGYPAHVLTVAIASPSDLTEERHALRTAVFEWNAENSESTGIVLQPAMWEIDVGPSYGEHPQATINRQIIDNCDLLIGCFWKTLGTQTENAASGTIEEIERVHVRGKPVSIYFSTKPVDVATVDLKQLEALRSYKRECQAKARYFDFNSPDALAQLVSKHLRQKVRDLHLPPPRPSRLAHGFVLEGDKLTLRATLQYPDQFATEADEETCILHEPRILLSRNSIRRWDELIGVLELVARRNCPLLLLAPSVSDEAHMTLVKNVKLGLLKACPVALDKAPDSREVLRAVQKLANGELLGDTGDGLRDLQFADLGCVQRAIVEPHQVTLFRPAIWEPAAQRSHSGADDELRLPKEQEQILQKLFPRLSAIGHRVELATLLEIIGDSSRITTMYHVDSLRRAEFLGRSGGFYYFTARGRNYVARPS